MHSLHFLKLDHTDVYDQLALEEALLRTDHRSFCLVNFGSTKSIVMGLSQDPNHLLEVSKVKQDGVTVIRRFSGGGTVIVDQNTFFVTFIIARDAGVCDLYPESIMRWTADVFQKAWNIPGFTLKENDFVIHDRKCGGNAQYIQKERFLHHTSFLWDYDEKNMEYLSLPSKRPKYRQDRSHTDFLCRVKSHVSSQPEDLVELLKKELVKQFYIQKFDEIVNFDQSYRKTLSKIVL